LGEVLLYFHLGDSRQFLFECTLLTIAGFFFAGLYILFYVNFATAWWMYLLLPIHFLIGPIQGAIVNWAGHKYGYRNFPGEKDQSKNTLFAAISLL
jgi:fatty-acid desaturase